VFTEVKIRICNITGKEILKMRVGPECLRKRALKDCKQQNWGFCYVTGITRQGHQRNTDVRENLNVANVVWEIQEQQRNWRKHIKRLKTHRIPKQALKFKPLGRRLPGHLKESWRVQLHVKILGRDSYA
jgi:hypothetical protein